MTIREHRPKPKASGKDVGVTLRVKPARPGRPLLAELLERMSTQERELAELRARVEAVSAIRQPPTGLPDPVVFSDEMWDLYDAEVEKYRAAVDR